MTTRKEIIAAAQRYWRRDTWNNEYFDAAGYADFVLASRDAEIAELVAALENCRLLAARHRKEEWAGHVLRLCESAGVAATALRSPK